MGKKKSVVLMSLITIVLLVLCVIVAFPSFVLPGSNEIKKWNPVAMQYDLGAEFNGGHYAYYYPTGVITEKEYNDNLGAYEAESDDWKEYKDSYQQYVTDAGVATSLYLSTDPDDSVVEDGKVSENFKTAFEKAVKVMKARFEERAKLTGSTYRLSIVDDYAIRVELSATENTENYTSSSYAADAFGQYAKFGDLTIETGTDESVAIVAELTEEGASINDLIQRITVKTQYKYAFLKIYFTAKGREMIKTFKDSENTVMNLKLDDELSLPISKTDNINTKNEVELPIAPQSDKLRADTLCVLLNSVMDEGTIYINEEREEAPISFRAPTSSEIASFEPVYGDVLVWVFVAVLAAMVIASVAMIIKFGGFGVMNLYTTLTYFVIAAICFAFISGGVFVFNFGSVLIFLAGLAIVNVLNAYIYGTIQNEVSQGKTIQSSVKGGYKKTLFSVIDIYAVLVLGGVALLIGVASLYTFACQALICLLAGAFCNLLWGRVINHMLLSASKDKYKYFRFVREEDEDDE